jgi:hypothetical protein
MPRQVFVSPSLDGWKVKTVGTEKAAGIFDTKAEAVDKGINVARNQGAELFVQNKDGKIGWKNSYGNDPHGIRG